MVVLTMANGLGNKILVGLITAVTAALAWQAYTLDRLETRIEGLERAARSAPTSPPARPAAGPAAETAAGETGAPSPTVVDAAVIESTVESAVETALRRSREAAGRAAPTSPDEEALEAAVGRVLEKQKARALDARGDRFLRKGAERLDGQLQELVDEGLIPAARRQQVLDLLVGELRETWRIKAEASREALGHEEAYEQWEEVRAEYTDALGGLIGEETAALLRERIDGGGK